MDRKPAVNEIEQMTAESASLLKEMIAIPSPSFGEDEVSDHVSGFLASAGIRHTRLYNNIIAVQPGYSPDKRTLMLCAHMDTVGPSDGYTFDPYRPDYGELANRHEWLKSAGAGSSSDIVAGLGANDDGASAVAMISAFRHFYDSVLPVNLMLVLGAEEERSGKNGMEAVWKALTDGTISVLNGQSSIIGRTGRTDRVDSADRTNSADMTDSTGLADKTDRTGRDDRPDAAQDRIPGSDGSKNGGGAGDNGETVRICPPDWAIIGEPTGMKAAIAERGLLVIDGLAEGVSGHAAREEGVNALYIAMDDIRTLRDFNFSRISPLMGTVKLTVTQINAGTVHNVVPDRCSFVVDIRPTEQYTNAEILAMLQSECRSTLTARNLKNRSSATAPDSPLSGCAEALGIETFVSPTTSDWMRIGCDAIKMGPGDSARSHRKDEYVTVGEIRDGIAKYIGFIKKFCDLA